MIHVTFIREDSLDPLAEAEAAILPFASDYPTAETTYLIAHEDASNLLTLHGLPGDAGVGAMQQVMSAIRPGVRVHDTPDGFHIHDPNNVDAHYRALHPSAFFTIPDHDSPVQVAPAHAVDFTPARVTAAAAARARHARLAALDLPAPEETVAQYAARGAMTDYLHHPWMTAVMNTVIERERFQKPLLPMDLPGWFGLHAADPVTEHVRIETALAGVPSSIYLDGQWIEPGNRDEQNDPHLDKWGAYVQDVFRAHPDHWVIAHALVPVKMAALPVPWSTSQR